jgi:hypothetical protein
MYHNHLFHQIKNYKKFKKKLKYYNSKTYNYQKKKRNKMIVSRISLYQNKDFHIENFHQKEEVLITD